MPHCSLRALSMYMFGRDVDLQPLPSALLVFSVDFPQGLSKTGEVPLAAGAKQQSLG